MRFATSVMGLAFIAAVTATGTGSAHAAELKQTEVASLPSDTKTQTVDKHASTITVTVKQGDTLIEIAKANDVRVKELVAENHIDDPDTIEPGTVLKVKKTGAKLADHYTGLRAAAQEFMSEPVEVETASVSAPTEPVVVAQAAVPKASVSKTASRSTARGNTYVWGTCTWYVYNRKPSIGNDMGSAYQWISSAHAKGYGVGSRPVAGAVGVQPGHVVYVEKVLNGGKKVRISEMNYAGGVGVVHYRTVPASTFTYIYA